MTTVGISRTVGASNESVESILQWMRFEAQAIERAAERLNPVALETALQILQACTRLVTVTGTGVSGLVAAKLAATLTTYGTPAVFVPASTALHGGLGIVRDGDVAVCVSNSGRTEDTVAVARGLARDGLPVIAFTGGPDSGLAGAATVVIDTSVSVEACPLNAVPTASSAVAVAIGDAIAAELSRRRGWTIADVARIHPAGAVGRMARDRSQ